MLVLGSLIAGCIPWPHRSNLTPGVTGTLTHHGTLVKGAALRLVVSEGADPCKGESKEFKATNDGEFYAGPIREFNPVLAVMAHTYFPWAVCIKEQSEWIAVHKDRTYTLADTGPAFLIEMSCVRADSWECEATHIWEPTPELISALEERNNQ